MAKRLTASRVSGIAAWSAAAVAWGTAAVAFVTPAPSTGEPAQVMEPPSPPVPIQSSVARPHASFPTMPETGLVIVRYTPVERPEAEVIVERRVVAATAPSTPAPRVKSSGS
ncbi:MAG: hypothetical protein DWP92_02620 [Armatimonadetes bacterium]|nr:MAG: hypothetical protein DWP92_02620 [Armatimonadota bacterium]